MMNDEILRINGFEIVEDGFDQDKNKYYEGIFTQGNGYFHVRGSFEDLQMLRKMKCTPER